VDGRFDLDGMARVYERARRQFPGARELWLENGRWLSARSGVLVVTVLEAKDRPRMRRLICDGGRTLHALVSQWETHGWLTLPERRGPECLTAIHGPTCMAFDQLARGPLPRSVRPNDRLVWLEAGAYHLSWETRFSHGLAAVFWHDGRTITQVRPGETFARWWGQWR
jgi:diaminopimelate decarboxylase